MMNITPRSTWIAHRDFRFSETCTVWLPYHSAQAGAIIMFQRMFGGMDVGTLADVRFNDKNVIVNLEDFREWHE
jgi:hypothetical protein